MHYITIIVVVILVNTSSATNVSKPELIAKSQKRISEQVLKLLEHYQQNDPIGVPGAPIPDPLSVPPVSHSFSVGNMKCKDVKLFGLSKFRLKYVKANITGMSVDAALAIDELRVFGNYTLSSWLSKARGPFTVKLSDVYVTANATLQIETSGQLGAQQMNMDIVFKSITVDFKGLGFFASMFQGIINSVGTVIFESVKPFILKEVNSNMVTDINKEVRKFPQKFPNSISPFDQLIFDVRKKIQNAKYDPFEVKDYNNSVGIFDIFLTHTWLYGVSSIHRVGDIIFEVKNNSVYALFEVGTQQLKGTSQWELALITGFLSKAGSFTFTVEYIHVQVLIRQPMDTRQSPQLEDIQLELGNIQIRFDGAGTLDYAIEFGVNVIPNLLRYQIMDAIEYPLKQRIQEEFNRINIEELVRDNSDKIDNPQDFTLF